MRLVLRDDSPLREIAQAAASSATKRLMGEYLLSQASAAFQDQRRGPEEWAPRNIPNVPGILRDLETAPRIKDRRFDARPALIDTGHLGRYSLAQNYEPTSRGFEVFSTVSYAPLMQDGGTSRIEITQAMLANLTILLRQARKRMKKARKETRKMIAEGAAGELPIHGAKYKRDTQLVGGGTFAKEAGLGWLFERGKNPGFIEVKVPARPFLTIEEDDVDALQKIAVKAAAKAAEG